MRSFTFSFSAVVASAALLIYAAYRIVAVQAGYTAPNEKTEPWFSDVAQMRELLYAVPRDESKPTIWVVAGSNALFGTASDVIADRTSYNVRNYALHGSLHINLLFSQIIGKVKRGDIVVAPLEWETRDKNFGSQFDYANYLHHFSKYTNPPLWMAFKLYASVPLSRWWNGLVAYIYREQNALSYWDFHTPEQLLNTWGQRGTPSVLGFVYSHRSLNETGDINVKRPMTYRTWAADAVFSVPDTITASWLATMDYWQAAFAGRGARLMVVPPIMFESSGRTVTSTATWRNIERMRALMATGKSPLNCDPIRSTFSSIYRYDTVYHPNAEGARVRSAELADCIVDSIRGADVRTKPIDPEAAVAKVEERLRKQKNNFGSGELPFQIRLRDLTAIRSALKSHHEKTGAYPPSSAGAEWNHLIGLQNNLGLILPRDPEGGDARSGHYYAYISDGRGYKIAVFGASLDCTVVAANWPEMIDPARITAGDPTDCAAYGYWTEDFANK